MLTFELWKEQNTITSSSGLSDEEINQMVKDEAHAADDEKLREKIDLVNRLIQLFFKQKSLLKKMKRKFLNKNNKLKKLLSQKKALEADDHEGIKSSLDILNEKMQSAATEMYANAQNSSDGNNQDNKNDNKSNPDIEEADFEIVDDDKDKKD